MDMGGLAASLKVALLDACPICKLAVAILKSYGLSIRSLTAASILWMTTMFWIRGSSILCIKFLAILYGPLGYS